MGKEKSGWLTCLNQKGVYPRFKVFIREGIVHESTTAAYTIIDYIMLDALFIGKVFTLVVI